MVLSCMKGMLQSAAVGVMEAGLEMKELVVKCVKALCDFPLEASAQLASSGERTICIFVSCRKEDLPKLIGKSGNNIRAMRTILGGCAAKHRMVATLILNE